MDRRSEPAGADLGAELRLSRPFDSDAERTYLELQRTASLLLQGFSHCIRAQFPAGEALTPSQYNVLRILRGAPAEGLTCGEVAERLVTPGPDVTRLLDRLEARACVERTRDAADRRVVRAHLSALGRRTVGALDEPVRRWLAGAVGGLDPASARRLWGLLGVLRDAPPPDAGTEPA